MQSGQTTYSDKIKGTRRNYNWSVRFDMTGGFLRIMQFDGNQAKDGVLMSPAQVAAMQTFIAQQKK